MSLPFLQVSAVQIIRGWRLAAGRVAAALRGMQAYGNGSADCREKGIKLLAEALARDREPVGKLYTFDLMPEA